MTTKADSRRPLFLSELSQAYSIKRKNLVLLTGDIYGLFWSRSKEDYVSLEEVFVHELGEKFNVVRMDIASGIGFYDNDTEREVIRVCESKDGVTVPTSREKTLRRLIQNTRHSPLPGLVLLKGMHEGFVRVREEEPGIKPMCVIFQYAGALFPSGDFSRLGDLDRQRLVLFLSWVTDPAFIHSPDILVMINTVKSEVNQKAITLPHATHIEVQLPDEKDRARFVEHFTSEVKGIRMEGGRKSFVANTAGLKLSHVKDLMEVAARSKKHISKEQVVEQVNEILQAELGDIIRIRYPAHTPKDIVGYKQTGAIFTDIFERCEDPETAVAAILVSGPNGGGKTFQLEAYAAESGRVVLELAGIRGSYFGETDRFFELLRWHIATFGKILILVDEAHTAFGSVHESGTHQTEMRLAGNIIKMMGDPTYLSKVLWGMMTSRPDELDPDIKSRAPIQVPIFDLEGEPRRDFVKEMFRRKRLRLNDPELDDVIAATDYYSARDYRNLVAEVLAQRRKSPKITVVEVMKGWHASKSIKTQREFQSMIAALHCSYPNLLPERYTEMGDAAITKRIEELKWYLQR